MKLFIGFLLGLVFVSCAYIVSKDSQDVAVTSTPTGAKVVIATTGGVVVYEGTTPASVNLKKKNEYVVTVSMKGYVEKSVQIDKAINPMVLGNLLCGGIPGLIVDGITGAMWNLEPGQIVITLQTASLNNGPEKLYAVLSWLNENGQTVNLPIEMVKK